MGVMRFLVHPATRMQDWPEVHRAYVCGYDQSVHPTRIEVAGQHVACRRQNADSGRFHVAWEVAGFGRPVLSTASLPEREEPYLLPVELARGKIVQVRNQLATWEAAGMQAPAGFSTLHHEAHALFAKAAASQERLDEACAYAAQALERACAAAERLTMAYAQQSLAARMRRFSQIPTLLGCALTGAAPDNGASKEFVQAFNSAIAPIEWRLIERSEGEYDWDACDQQVDWCEDHRLMIRGGPLLDFSPEGLPAWLATWEHDVWNLQSFVCDFVETALKRYAGRIRTWEISARGNSGGALALTEENRLALVAKSLEVARHLDEEAQLFIRVDQPWGEYLARGQHRLSPLHFCDALVRANIGLSGVNLEIAVGYRPRGTHSRDVMEFSRLIDLWSGLGVPLHVMLAFPSQTGPDLQSTVDLEVDRAQWKAPWSEAAQAEWVDLFLPLLIAKPAVTGVYWAHYADAEPHSFPHAGLTNEQGHAKPALQRCIQLRQTFLK